MANEIQTLIRICSIHLHIHHMSRIPFLILIFLDFVIFVVRSFTKMCFFSTNVAILFLLFKRAIIAPNRLIEQITNYVFIFTSITCQGFHFLFSFLRLCRLCCEEFFQNVLFLHFFNRITIIWNGIPEENEVANIIHFVLQTPTQTLLL